MVAASPRYRVKRSDFSQVFLLDANAPTGSYIKINFHGSLQQQLEDMRYYIAVRHVAVFGRPLDESLVAREGFDKFLFTSPSISTFGVSEFVSQRLIWKKAEPCDQAKIFEKHTRLQTCRVRREDEQQQQKKSDNDNETCSSSISSKSGTRDTTQPVKHYVWECRYVGQNCN